MCDLQPIFIVSLAVHKNTHIEAFLYDVIVGILDTGSYWI